MTAPRVYNIRRDPPPEAVYIGRAGHGQAGYWGNPISLMRQCPICTTTHQNTAAGRLAACECYEAHLERRLDMDPEFERRFDALEGKDLVCFCAPAGGLDDQQPWTCHGQVMLTVIARRRAWALRRADRALTP